MTQTRINDPRTPEELEALLDMVDAAISKLEQEWGAIMTTKTDGGPAYPLPVNDEQCRARFESGYGGMSMRDAFALAALQGLLANPGGPIQSNIMNGWNWCNCTAEDVANLTYSMADAMLAAREISP